jgi:hypothetical protein
MKGYFFLGFAAFVVALLCFTLYAVGLGLYMAFSASVLLGFVVLLVEPAPLVIGLWWIFFGVDLAEKIMITFS